MGRNTIAPLLLDFLLLREDFTASVFIRATY